MSEPQAPVLPKLPERLPGTLQELDPQSARLALRLEQYCRDSGAALPGRKILIALSGGTDSLSLAVLLAALRQRLRVSLAACHLEHGLRPSAGGEQNWVGDFCAKLDIAFFPRRAAVRELAQARKIGLEEAGRRARYAAFQALLDGNGFELLVLGHTLTDLCEDVLLRLLRGCGWPGLGGMRAYVPERRLLRPLLFAQRAELAGFLERIGLPHLEDESNHSDEFLRNRLRKLLAVLQRENPGLPRHIASLNRLAGLDAEYWNRELARLGPETETGCIRLSRPELAGKHQALRLRAYLECIRQLGKGQARFDNLLNIDAACLAYSHQPSTRKVIELPHGVRAVIAGPELLFFAIE